VLTDQLRASLASRSVIAQALGVIMAEQRCTAEEAFAILRTASHNRNVKLRQVAQDIVTGITGKPPQPPPFSPPPTPPCTPPRAARQLNRMSDRQTLSDAAPERLRIGPPRLTVPRANL
jgi:ANTAR domain